ncbi:LOW QUALITY PROTEIN: Transmembrane protein [Phytophthora palmivora]|uniref:Transmembrane protein n=1 Tax=Phytophthora palmivora TaxID=4796 RepID=A0A2P4X1D4_9STRA|nr:LOW QUALITY PROTEIN: Transmembrane protein [Phytophthora palmivora]
MEKQQFQPKLLMQRQRFSRQIFWQLPYELPIHNTPSLFWECSIEHTPMSKSTMAGDVDASVMKQCGRCLASNLPIFVMNMMFLSNLKNVITPHLTKPEVGKK